MGLLDFNRDVVLARLEADFSDQPPSIPAVPNHQVSLQCPTTKYPCSAQLPSIPAGPNRKVSLQCRTAEYPWSAQQQSINILAAHLQCCKEDSRGGGGRETLHFLCNNVFRVGMLEVSNIYIYIYIFFFFGGGGERPSEGPPCRERAPCQHTTVVF